MARTIKKLIPTKLNSLDPGRHIDGQGLYFQVTQNHTRSWIFRFMLRGQARQMGLGPFPDVSLSEARNRAETARALLRNGIDPIDARIHQKGQADATRAQKRSFEACAREFIETKKAGWHNPKHAAQWSSTLETHAYPIIGNLPVDAINTEHILKVLTPIWRNIPETASRVRGRIEAILDWAKVMGYRTGDNPALWRGHLTHALPRRGDVRAVRHHEAMPYAQMPTFFPELRKRETISAKALAFTIITAARSGETRHATLREIDFQNAIWTIPAERMKSGREHRVPLTDAALDVLRSLPHLNSATGDTLLFPNPWGRPLSETAMRKYLQDDLKHPSLTVHGFRSTFRDWVAEQTHFPRELAEAALAHVLKDKTEAAYLRGDMLKRRRELMEAWADFCQFGSPSEGIIAHPSSTRIISRPSFGHVSRPTMRRNVVARAHR